MGGAAQFTNANVHASHISQIHCTQRSVVIAVEPMAFETLTLLVQQWYFLKYLSLVLRCVV